MLMLIWQLFVRFMFHDYHNCLSQVDSTETNFTDQNRFQLGVRQPLCKNTNLDKSALLPLSTYTFCFVRLLRHQHIYNTLNAVKQNFSLYSLCSSKRKQKHTTIVIIWSGEGEGGDAVANQKMTRAILRHLEVNSTLFTNTAHKGSTRHDSQGTQLHSAE